MKDAEIGPPALKLKQRIVVAAEVLGQRGCASYYLIEHSADSRPIDGAWLYDKADDAPGELIHHHHHPVRLNHQRFTTKEIDAPEAVFGMSEEGSVAAEGRRYFV